MQQVLKRPLGNVLVPYGTPLHVSELFLQLLKITFADTPEDHPYHYDEKNFDKSGLAFDITYNKESKIYGKKPLVVVSRAAQSTQPIVVGDLSGARLQIGSSTKHGSGMVNSGITASVLSRSKAEAEILCQHIFGLCMMCRTQLPELLGVHFVQSITLGEVARMEDDDAMYMGQISVQYVTQYKWSTTTSEPILQKIYFALGQLRNKVAEPSEEQEKFPDLITPIGGVDLRQEQSTSTKDDPFGFGLKQRGSFSAIF